MTHKHITRHLGIMGPLLMAALLATACATDELPDGGSAQGHVPLALWAEIEQQPVTRVNDDGFADGDRMGVYVVDYEGDRPGTLLVSGNHADNVRHTYQAETGSWQSAYDIFWKDKHTHADIYAYYPMGLPQSIGAYEFTVRSDQNSEATPGTLGGYEASDFLWGKAQDIAPTTSRVRLAMRHRMACVRVTLAMGEGFTTGEWAALEKQVQVVNVVRKATIDLATGTVQPAGEVERVATTPLHSGSDWRAIVVPQTVAGGTTLMDITLDGLPYRFGRAEDFTFQAGKMNNFTIQVNRKHPQGDYTLTLLGESITPWENDPVSHDAAAREYLITGSSMGHLADSLAARGLSPNRIQSLKVTGSINNDDLHYMKDNMPNLRNLNLKEVRVENDIFPDGLAGSKALTRIVLPDHLERIGHRAFSECSNLSGSLIIPEGVTVIEEDAFGYCTMLAGSLTLPSTLKEIWERAFERCGFTCELQLPQGLERIKDAAFYVNQSLYGNLILPESLVELGNDAFAFANFSGDLVIPQGVKEIGRQCFNLCRSLDGTLALHDGIIYIGSNAFYCTRLRGELVLPKRLSNIPEAAFQGSNFSHIVFPDELVSIGKDAFNACSRLTGKVTFPKGLSSIGNNAFEFCSSIQEIDLPASLETIGESAFGQDFSIEKITCQAGIPPTVSASTFEGVPKDNFVVEVPEGVVADYQTAPYWREFKHIAAHHELTCSPAMACALNAGQEQNLALHAEGAWTVESKPEWCALSQMSGNGDTGLTLTINALPHGAGDREGEVVFLLDDKDYTCTLRVTQRDYAHDRDEWVTLQKATEGQRGGIDIVLLGDGFDATDIANGSMLETMRQQAERFFGIEPYKTYRQYFNVYAPVTLSQDSGIGTESTPRDTRFGTTYTGGTGLTGDYTQMFRYVLGAPTVSQDNLSRTLIIVVPNTTDYGGTTQMWADGSAISFCPPSEDAYPYDARGIIQHEAGGHGFGKLGDECIRHSAFITACGCSCCPHEEEFREGQSRGWYANLSLTGKMHEVPWSQLMSDPQYSAVVDVYEGGFMHRRGVFRSEQNSCMNNNVPYFNAISRMAIVRRIKEYAGETFSIDDFKSRDVMDASTVTRSAGTAFATSTRQHAPVVHKGSPLGGMRHTGNRRAHRQSTGR